MVMGMEEDPRLEAIVEKWLDLSRWPLVVVTSPDTVDPEAFEYHLARVRRKMREKSGDFAMIVDLRRNGRMTPMMRKQLVNNMKHQELEQVQGVSAALVFNSELVRMLLTGVMWMKKPTHPFKVFSTISEAEEWSLAQLEQAKSRAG